MADAKPIPIPERLDVDHWAGKLLLSLIVLIGGLFWIVVLLGVLT